VATAITAVLALMVAMVATAPPAAAASLQEITNFGTNPSGLRMYLYVPDNIGTRPAVLVAVHYCTGSGPAFFSGTQFAQLADQFKFIVVYPSATRSGSCFDVSSPQALRHNGGSDPVGINSMVQWVLANRGGDASRVFVTGASSGGMMTNVLLGDYPDVFKAGAAFMGVPFGCFATTDGSMWNTACANGQISHTPQEWGDMVRNAFPGYTGPRPRMQVWHGDQDTTLQFPNFGEEIKQWTNVLGVSQTPSTTDTPQSGWTRTRYGGTGTMPPVEAIRIAGVGHSLPLSGQAAMAVAFFGLNTTQSPPPSSPPASQSPSPRPSSSPSASPSVSPSPRPSGGPGGCSAVATVQTQWDSGYVIQPLTVTNTGSSGISSWTVTFTLPAGHTMTGNWNVTASTSGQTVTFKSVGFNGTLAPGASTTSVGFQASRPSGNTALPSGYTCTSP